MASVRLQYRRRNPYVPLFRYNPSSTPSISTPRRYKPRIPLNTDHIVSTATTLAPTKSASPRPLAAPSDIYTLRSAGHLRNAVTAVSNCQEYVLFFHAAHHANPVTHIHNNRSQPFGPANMPPSPAHRRPSHARTAARDAATVSATGSFGLSSSRSRRSSRRC
jgi:hypothetical protein